MKAIFSITIIEQINRWSSAFAEMLLGTGAAPFDQSPSAPAAGSVNAPGNSQAAAAHLLDGPCFQRSAGANSGNKKVSSAVLETVRANQKSSGAHR
jgi:hypothetical protein